MKSVLLVDDSEIFYNLMKKVMKEVRVEWARYGEEAIKIYREKKPDIVLVDIILPDMSGIEIIKKIREEDSNAKIIVLSGIDHDEVVEDAKRAGAHDYISKSEGVQYLRERIYEELKEN